MRGKHVVVEAVRLRPGPLDQHGGGGLPVAVIHRQRDPGGGAGLPQDLRPQREIVVIAQRVVARTKVLPVAVAHPLVMISEVCGDRVADGAGDVAVEPGGVVVAIAELDVALGGVRRRLGHDLDQPAGRVAAEQRALRALQHLDPVDVGERHDRAGRAGKVHAIEIDRDRVLDAGAVGGRADAAERRAHEADADRHLQAGGELAHVDRVGDAGRF